MSKHKREKICEGERERGAIHIDHAYAVIDRWGNKLAIVEVWPEGDDGAIVNVTPMAASKVAGVDRDTESASVTVLWD